MRIYPSRQSSTYDQFFQGPRPLNKLLHKVLYSDKVLKAGSSMVKSPTATSFMREEARPVFSKYNKKLDKSATSTIDETRDKSS